MASPASVGLGSPFPDTLCIGGLSPPRSHRDDVRWAEETSPDRQPRADTRALRLVGGGGTFSRPAAGSGSSAWPRSGSWRQTCSCWEAESITPIRASVIASAEDQSRVTPARIRALPLASWGPAFPLLPVLSPSRGRGEGGPPRPPGAQHPQLAAPPDLQVPAERSSPGGWAPLISHCTWLFPSRADG